jgi:hypothetical protein
MEGREKKDDTAVLIKIEDFPSKKKYMLFGMFGWLPEFVCIGSPNSPAFSPHTHWTAKMPSKGNQIECCGFGRR